MSSKRAALLDKPYPKGATKYAAGHLSHQRMPDALVLLMIERMEAAIKRSYSHRGDDGYVGLDYASWLGADLDYRPVSDEILLTFEGRKYVIHVEEVT